MNILKPSMEAIRNASVLVVGDAMLDRYWFGDASRISPEAPVPVVKVTRTEDRLGGAASSQPRQLRSPYFFACNHRR